MLMTGILVGFLLAGPVAAQEIPPATAGNADEVAVLALDKAQRDAVANMDLNAIAEISHPNLRVNAPNNRVITRDDLVRMVGSGDIRNEVFERTPETLVITGDVAVVMGREAVFPGATSEQAKMYGERRLNRRYTNIYLREKGVWRHLARHANIIR